MFGAVKISDSRRAVIIIVIYSLSFLSVSVYKNMIIIIFPSYSIPFIIYFERTYFCE